MSAVRSIPRALRAWITSPEAELSRWQRIVANAAALALHCARELRRVRAPQMAAALAYRTIFGLIPTLVLSLIVLRFFYADDIETPLRRVLGYAGLSDLVLPADGSARGAGATAEPEALGAWIEGLVERVSTLNFAAIGVVGVLVLIYAALSLMTEVERSFNTVYKARAGRTVIARLTQYWAVLTLGPIGVFASFWLSDRCVALMQSLGAGGVVNALGVLPALAASWLVLTLAYVAVPTARVRLRPALAGAAVAATLWELGKWGFAEYLTLATGYASFYGSLGLLPVFLLWVYLTWLIVLFGLELAYATQTLDRGIESFRRPDAGDSRADSASALAALAAVVAAFRAGAPADASRVARDADLTDGRARDALAALERAGAVHQIERPDEAPAAWSLSKPPESIALAPLAETLVGATAPDAPSAARAGAGVLREGLARALAGRTAADLAPDALADPHAVP